MKIGKKVFTAVVEQTPISPVGWTPFRMAAAAGLLLPQKGGNSTTGLMGAASLKQPLELKPVVTAPDQ